MVKSFVLLPDAEIRAWLDKTEFPLISCDVRTAASALMMLNREAGFDSCAQYIRKAAVYLMANGHTEIDDITWKACLRSGAKRKDQCGLSLLGFFCINGTALKPQDLPNYYLKHRFSPFFTLTSCYRMLKEVERRFKEQYSLRRFKELRWVINALIIQADADGDKELTHKIFMKVMRSRAQGSRFTEYIHHTICATDRLFNLHWENPHTHEPYTPLNLPTEDETRVYFESLTGDESIRIDALIVKTQVALKDFGESRHTISMYITVLRRFHWYCFKKGEKHYCKELFDEYLAFEKSISSDGKLSWISVTAGPCCKVLAAVASTGKIPADVFKHVRVKYDDQSIEKIRKELKMWVTKERKLSASYARRHDNVFRMVLEGADIATTEKLKKLDDVGLDKILSLIEKRCPKLSSLATLLPVLATVLKWLYERGYVESDLSSGVIRPHYIVTYDPPYLNLSNQKRFYKALEKESWRTRAIGHLGLDLGLRDCDIVALRLCDFNFRRKVLSIVQRKTGVPLELPLNDAIIKFIRNYIRIERPRPYTDHSEPVFLSKLPPFRPLTRVYHIIREVLESNGIKVENGTAKGTHLLRYSLGHALMKNETPHKIITDTLGHSDADADRPYIATDIEMLRACALDLSLIGKGRGFDED